MSEDQIKALREREPVAWLFEELYVGRGGVSSWHTRLSEEKPTEHRPDVRNTRPLYLDPPPTSELEAENTRLKARLAEALEALEPFSDMAGEMFARGWNASDVAIALDSPDGPHRVTAGDFFAARRVREGGKSDE